MKRLLSLFLCFSLFLSAIALPASAQEASNSEIPSISEFEKSFPSNYSHNTSYTDDAGNNVYIEFEIIGTDTYVQLYVNDVLTQRAYSSPNRDLILWTEYSSCARNSLIPSVQNCAYSDVISDITFQASEKEEAPEFYSSAFSPEGWSFLMTRASNSMISGSKPCSVYYKNYDEEPDQNRYSGKQVKAGAGTAVSVIVSVVAVFITGGVTVKAIVIALGSAIISDYITQAITGTVCFSTQKVRYAPVIEGVNIFPDAYITKRWVVIADTVHQTETVELDTPEYQYNRGHDAYAIAANAQQAEVDSRG